MKKINIIPLGENCIPRTILARWKIKPKKLFGERTYPFDLAVFGMLEVTKTLRTDFKEMFDNLEYKDGYWFKAPNCIYYYREKQFNQNDKQKLIDLYKKRIENFHKTISDETPILFVQIIGDCEDIDNQYIELQKLRGNKPFKFAIIDTQNIAGDKSYNSDIYILKQSFPDSFYKNHWWEKKCYKSKAGIAFEKTISDFCYSIIKTM